MAKNYRAIQELHNGCAGLLKNAKGKDVLLEQKLLSLFPEKHLQAYSYACTQIEADESLDLDAKLIREWNLRGHLITDFVSGMTDDFALSTFQTLSGIKAH